MTSQQLPASLCWGATFLDRTSGEPDIWSTVFVSCQNKHSEIVLTQGSHRCFLLQHHLLFSLQIQHFSHGSVIQGVRLHTFISLTPNQKLVVAALQSCDDRQHFPLSKHVLNFLAICLFWSSLSSRYKKTHTHRMIIISLCEGIHCHSHFLNHFQFPRPVTLQDRRH